MKLYYAPGACSLVVRIIINEIGIKSDFESVNLMTKTTETGQNFLKINSKGAVPVLQLNNGDILTENAVILQYLADQSNATQLLPPTSNFERYRVLEWVNYIATELHKGIGILFNPKITETLKNDVFFPSIKSKLKFIDQHLQNHAYLMGEHFTLPDAYLFVMLRWCTYFKFELKEWSNLHRYFTALQNRASIQKSLQQE